MAVSRFPEYLAVFMKWETGFCGLLIVSQVYSVIGVLGDQQI